MGKYMKKSKITGDGAVMEIPKSSSSSSFGVRTRARALALQPNPELSYLQLRNRRLEKPPFQTPTTKQGPKHGCGNSKIRVGSGSFGSGHVDKGQGQGRFGKIEKGMVGGGGQTGKFHDVVAETSCGENNLEFDTRERSMSMRESTPCSSVIRDTETNVEAPGSNTKATCSSSTDQQAWNTHRTILTTPEMEEFFAGFESIQQKQFIEKYNFDIMNDLPLPGRYEWVKVDN